MSTIAAAAASNDTIIPSPTRLNIFDFDGTLFRSPVPNADLWSSPMCGRLLAKKGDGGLGWFSAPESLSSEYGVPELPGKEWLVDRVVEDVRQSMENTDAMTTLLTGRSLIFHNTIKRIIDYHELSFDFVGLKDPPSENTLVFKRKYLLNFLSENPSIRHISMWEDRKQHIKLFKKFLTSLIDSGRIDTYNIVHIRGCSSILPEDIELSLVTHMVNCFNSSHSTQDELEIVRKISYVSVVLQEEMTMALLQAVSAPDPMWRPYGHHCTIALGTLAEVMKSSDRFSHFIDGENVSFSIVGIGRNDSAVSLWVSGVASINCFPHITLYVAPDERPSASNSINCWVCFAHAKLGCTECLLSDHTNEHFTPCYENNSEDQENLSWLMAAVKNVVTVSLNLAMTGTVREIAKLCLQPVVEPPLKDKGVAIGKLSKKLFPVFSSSPNGLRNICIAVKDWMKTHNVEDVEVNTVKVEECLKQDPQFDQFRD